MVRWLIALVWLTGCSLPEKECSGRDCQWGTPKPVFPDQDPAIKDDSPTLNVDMTEMYFVRLDPAHGMDRIYVTTRTHIPSTDQVVGEWTPWINPHEVMMLASSGAQTTPQLTPDGLTLYVASNMHENST